MHAPDPVVQVVEYRTDWPAVFVQLRERIWPSVCDLAAAIEHVGSTAVPGLSGKPRIDIDIVIGSSAHLPTVVDRLGMLGYSHRGNLGIEGRDVFDACIDSPPHNLYVCPAGALSLRNHLTLRDHLRSHPLDAAAYAALKRRLAAEFPNDRGKYVEGKTEFILAILAQYGFADTDLNFIQQANKVIRNALAACV